MKTLLFITVVASLNVANHAGLLDLGVNLFHNATSGRFLPSARSFLKFDVGNPQFRAGFASGLEETPTAKTLGTSEPAARISADDGKVGDGAYFRTLFPNFYGSKTARRDSDNGEEAPASRAVDTTQPAAGARMFYGRQPQFGNVYDVFYY